ncbi:MAG: autotransporter assembly complex family protein [Paracoccaceae bacterium]
MPRSVTQKAGFTAVLTLALALPALALDRLDFSVAGQDKALTKSVRASSLLLSQQADGATNAQDLFTAARSDYARILSTLYTEGHYSAIISIRIDGREVAEIAPLNAPSRIGTITVSVDPGPTFAFSRATIAPVAPDTDLPSEFATGQTARSTVITQAEDAAILAWREDGHAKAVVAAEDLVANHPDATLSADIRVAPGPALRFGALTVTGAERMRVNRIIKIAGLRYGERFSQSELDRASQRLKRAGVFSSVTLTEADYPVAGDLLPITATVVEEKLRRYSLGAEIASLDGLALTGYWLHRNVNGGAERLKIEGSITNIGAGTSGMDYNLGASLERPATFSPDATATLSFNIGHLDEVDYYADYAEIGLGLRYYFSEQLTARTAINYEYAEGSDPGGKFRFRSLAAPTGVTWDRRDDAADAHKGFYLDATIKPFWGFDTTGSGARLTLDARGYRSFGARDRVTLAARFQAGAILGSDLLDTPRDDLFFSGGGGTVRGHPYRSLGVVVNRGFGPDFLIGGTHMLAISAEVRARVTDTIGVVAFADAGQIGADGFFDDGADWQAGAGLGLRYATGFGPIRLDIAAPVHGKTGDGVQFYIGLGQSF